MFTYSNTAIDSAVRIFLIGLKDPKGTALRNYAKVQGRFLDMDVVNALLTASNCPEAVMIRSAKDWVAIGNPVLSWMDRRNIWMELPGGFPYRIFKEKVTPEETFGVTYSYIQMFPNSVCRYPDIPTETYRMQVIASALLEVIGRRSPLDRDHHLDRFLSENNRPLLALFEPEEQYIRYRDHVPRADANLFLECLLHEFFVYILAGMDEKKDPERFVRSKYTYTAGLITLICMSALHLATEPEKIHVVQNLPEGDSEILRYLVRCRELAKELIDEVMWTYYRKMDEGVPVVSYRIKEAEN